MDIQDPQPAMFCACTPGTAPSEAIERRSREIKGSCCYIYLLIPFCSPVVFLYSLVHDGCSFILFFSTSGTRNASKSPLNNTYIPPSPASLPHLTRSLPSYLRSYSLQTLRFQTTTKTTHHQSWARVGCIVSLMR